MGLSNQQLEQEVLRLRAALEALVENGLRHGWTRETAQAVAEVVDTPLSEF